MGDDLIVRKSEVPLEGESKLISRDENAGEEFTLVFKSHGHYVDFQIFKIYLNTTFVNGVKQDDPELVLYASGALRFDGCCNMQWHTDKIMAHFCGKRDAIDELTKVMTAIYDLGPEMKESWIGG